MLAKVRGMSDSPSVAAPTELYICRTCKPEGFAGEPQQRPGFRLAEAMARRVIERQLGAVVTVKSVDCLSVCKRPCTVAVTGAGKFGYVVGDVEVGRDIDPLIDYAVAFGRTADGITVWRERPEIVKRHTVARIPPFGAASIPVAAIDLAASAAVDEVDERTGDATVAQPGGAAVA